MTEYPWHNHIEAYRAAVPQILSGQLPVTWSPDLDAPADPVPKVLELVCFTWAVPQSQLFSRDRTKETLVPRYAAWLILNQDCGLSYSELGRRFGRDHATVINGVKRAERWAIKSKLFRARLDALRKALDS